MGEVLRSVYTNETMRHQLLLRLDSNGRTALHVACAGQGADSNGAVARCLLAAIEDKGVQQQLLSIKDGSNRTAMDVAWQTGHAECQEAIPHSTTSSWTETSTTTSSTSTTALSSTATTASALSSKTTTS